MSSDDGLTIHCLTSSLNMRLEAPLYWAATRSCLTSLSPPSLLLLLLLLLGLVVVWAIVLVVVVVVVVVVFCLASLVEVIR